MAIPRHIRFAQEYAIDLNGQAAAIRAGFSAKTAGVKAAQLLKLPHVQAEIQRITDRHAGKLGVKLERVLQELALIAFVDPGDFYGPKGELLPINKMPEHVRRALHGFDVEVLVSRLATVTKIRYEKRAALHDLLEHLAPRRVELTGKDGKPLVPAARADLTGIPTKLLEEYMKKVAGS